MIVLEPLVWRVYALNSTDVWFQNCDKIQANMNSYCKKILLNILFTLIRNDNKNTMMRSICGHKGTSSDAHLLLIRKSGNQKN
jgi:hypothetical protein